MVGRLGWGGWVGIMEWKQKPSLFQRWYREARGMRLSYLAVQTHTSYAAHYLAGVSITGFSSIGLSNRSQDLCSWSNPHPGPLFIWVLSVLPCLHHVPTTECIASLLWYQLFLPPWHHPPWSQLGRGLSKVSSTTPYRMSLGSEALLFGAV